MTLQNFKSVIILFLVSATVFSCSKPARKGVPISVNLEKAVSVPFSSEDGVLLEEGFIGSVDDALMVDSAIVFKSGNELNCIHLTQNGSIKKLSRIGRGPGEYIQIWDFGLDENLLYLYDIDGKQILYFSLDGDFICSKRLSDLAADCPFQAMIPAPWGKEYVGKRVFGMPDVPELSLYDDSFHYLDRLGKDDLRSGIKLWRQLYRGSDDDILYCRYFSNEVLHVMRNDVSVKYSVDFINRNVPPSEDEYEILEKLSKEQAKSRYATIMGQMEETDDHFCFQFVTDARRLFAFYEKTTGRCRIYQPEVADQDIEQLLFYHGILYVISQDKDDSLWLYSKELFPS